MKIVKFDHFQFDKGGCWSSVGQQSRGQVLCMQVQVGTLTCAFSDSQPKVSQLSGPEWHGDS